MVRFSGQFALELLQSSINIHITPQCFAPLTHQWHYPGFNTVS